MAIEHQLLHATLGHAHVCRDCVQVATDCVKSADIRGARISLLRALVLLSNCSYHEDVSPEVQLETS